MCMVRVGLYVALSIYVHYQRYLALEKKNHGVHGELLWLQAVEGAKKGAGQGRG